MMEDISEARRVQYPIVHPKRCSGACFRYIDSELEGFGRATELGHQL